MREKSIGKSQLMSISTILELKMKQQQQKRDSHNCFLITHQMKNKKKKNEKKNSIAQAMHRPKQCVALFKSSFFIHKTRASVCIYHIETKTERERERERYRKESRIDRQTELIRQSQKVISNRQTQMQRRRHMLKIKDENK